MHPGNIVEAYDVFRETWSLEELREAHEGIAPFAEQIRSADGDCTVELTREVVVIGLPGQAPFEIAAGRIDGVLEALLHGQATARDERPSLQQFRALVARLRTLGLLVPPPGAVDFGDLRRLTNLCYEFGFSRGDPIDRHYLRRFVEATRSLVHGRVVEVGGRMSNRATYGYDAATEYVALDLGASDEVTMVADITDPASLAPASVDTFVCFNVLEHIAEPQKAVDTMRRALRPGGVALALTPTVQRLHAMPNDYWRPMPAGLAHLFRAYASVETHVYGNILASVAALMGIAAEELDPGELDRADPNYPVAVAVVARK